MMGIQPGFELRSFTVLNRLCEVGHDVFATNSEMKSILKDEGIEHSLDECRILCLTSHLVRTRPVEPRELPLVISWKGSGRLRSHSHPLIEGRRLEHSH